MVVNNKFIVSCLVMAVCRWLGNQAAACAGVVMAFLIGGTPTAAEKKQEFVLHELISFCTIL
jgi:hypothetical protein